MDRQPCPDELAILSFVDRRLDPERYRACERHFDECADCRRVLAEIGRALPAQRSGSEEDAGGPQRPATLAVPLGLVGARYRLERLIGSGAMGVVFAAHDLKLDRRVALKMMRVDAQEAERVARRVMREARALARLSHVNVITIFDAGAQGTELYLAMELVEGMTLREWLRTGPRAVPEILSVLVQVGRGLVAAHAAGFVHRDIKPDNVLLDGALRARVTDFGLVQMRAVPDVDEQPGAGAADRPAAVTHSTRMVGTPAYMPPEQFLGRADERSDQFSFCVTCWEALFGVRPFADGDINPVGPRRLIDSPNASRVPRALRRVLARGLQTDPKKRHESMAALVALLERHRRPVWRRRLRLAAGMVLLGAAVAGARVAHRQYVRAKVRACQREDLLRESWNEARRAAASKAFAAVDAAATWRRVERTLDQYAQRWSAASREICEARLERGDARAAASDPRLACLAERQAELGQLVTLFTRPATFTADRAPIAALQLTPINWCSDEHLLASMGRSVAPSAVVLPLANELARIRALMRVGLHSAAVEAFAALIEKARRVGAHQIETQALVQQARALVHTNDLAGAENAAYAGIAAAESIGDDYDVALGWIALTHAYSRQSRLADGLRASRLAASAVSRLANDDFLTIALEDALGQLSMPKDPSEAFQHYQKAIRIADRIQLDDGRLPQLLSNAAAALLGRQRYRDALPYAERALEASERALGADSPLTAYPSANLGIIESGLGRNAQAIEHLQRAVVLFTRGDGADSQEAALAKISLAEVMFEQRRFEVAIALAKGTVSTFRRKAARSPYLGLAEYVLGSALERRDRLDEALAAYTQARDQFLDDDTRATAETGIGRVLVAQGRLTEGLRILERALAHAEKRTPSGLAGTRFALARALWERGPRYRQRARELATAARGAWAQIPSARLELGELDAWRRDKGL